MTPGRWRWETGTASGACDDRRSAVRQAAGHARPGEFVTVEFRLLQAGAGPLNPVYRRTGFGYRGQATAVGIDWMAVSNLLGPGDAKPTAAEFGIDLTVPEWKRSGTDCDVIEVALPVNPPYWTAGDWVLMRHARTPDEVLVFDRNEWDCFLFALTHGEFDDIGSAGAAQPDVLTGGS